MVFQNNLIFCMDKDIIIQIRDVVTSLVNKDYKKIIASEISKWLNEEQLHNAVEEFGGQLTHPPPDDFQKSYIYLVSGKDVARVDYDVWVDGQKSDLTVQLEVQIIRGKYEYSVEGLHVL